MPTLPLPVLLGADLNCYSMARAFYEAYGIRARAFGKQALGATQHSMCLDFTAVPRLGEREVAIRVLRDLAARETARPLLLIPTTDEYALLVMREREHLAPYHIAAPSAAWLPYFEKTAFYRACHDLGIPYPYTLAYTEMPDAAELARAGEALGYPYVLKPADSAAYWRAPFEGMEKVYFPKSADEAGHVLRKIFSAGYRGEVLLQKYLGGGDTAAATLTVYCDRHGRAHPLACARVLLEEHTPRAKGNYAALMTAPLPAVTAALCAFLEAGNYRGFANFDLHRNGKTGEYFVLEMNMRQGRSNWFLTANGHNPARILTEDLIFCRDLAETPCEREMLYRSVPFSVLVRHVGDRAVLAAARRARREGREADPYAFRLDLLGNPRRAFYVFCHRLREIGKFRRFAPRGQNGAFNPHAPAQSTKKMPKKAGEGV